MCKVKLTSLKHQLNIQTSKTSLMKYLGFRSGKGQGESGARL